MTIQLTPPPAADLMPSDNYPPNDPNKVVWLGDSSLQPPVKTITFTNNTDNTVYPFFVAANSNSMYDTQDPSTKNYRGYIGFTWNGSNYLGLPAGQTIIVTVPIVFWDSGRIYVASNNTDLINHEKDGETSVANPYQYYRYNSDGNETLRYQQTMAQPLTPSNQPAVVMWYQGSTVHGPADDAPAQLLEYSIKDPWLRDKMNPDLPKDIGLGPLINYDVSYVDNICLPVTMAATDVPVPNSTVVKSYGWIGTSQTVDQFQNALKTFASSGSENGLGVYFGTDNNGANQGFTEFNIPAAAATVKLPSGAGAIADSPLQNARSSYSLDNNLYMLSSGGTAGIEADINASPIPGGSATLPLTFNAGPSGDEQKATLDQAKDRTMDVTCTDSRCQGLIQPGTKLDGHKVDPNGSTGTATLSKATNPISSATSCTVNFKRPVTDYVTTTIASLWYAWAKYYVDTNQQVGSPTYNGSITVPSSDPKVSRVLTFDTPIPTSGTQLPLVPGMLVTGPGIPTSADGSFCTIADVVENQEKPAAIVAVMLSEFVTESSSGTYQFEPPQPIRGNDDAIVQPPVQLTFSKGSDTTTAQSFSQAVYQAMSAISTIPMLKNYPYLSMWVVYNVIGCNTGQVPNIGNDSKIPDIAAEITVNIKSALRGVPNFQDTANWPESKWYPDPSQAMGGHLFNVYNLDPYVWFVHRQLGLSGYGFSVDDDTSDVGANAATNLQISIGGLGGLKTLGQWTNGAPYGPVSGSGQIQIVPNSDGTKTYKIINLPNTPDNPLYSMITNPNTAAGEQGALINGKHIQPGTRILSTENWDNGVILDSSLASDAVSGETYTYAFFGPVVGVGQAESPNLITELDAAVIDQLNTIVTQTESPIRVTGPGLLQGAMVQSVDATYNSVTLIFPLGGQLQQASGVYTFG